MQTHSNTETEQAPALAITRLDTLPPSEHFETRRDYICRCCSAAMQANAAAVAAAALPFRRAVQKALPTGYLWLDVAHDHLRHIFQLGAECLPHSIANRISSTLKGLYYQPARFLTPPRSWAEPPTAKAKQEHPRRAALPIFRLETLHSIRAKTNAAESRDYALHGTDEEDLVERRAGKYSRAAMNLRWQPLPLIYVPEPPAPRKAVFQAEKILICNYLDILEADLMDQAYGMEDALPLLACNTAALPWMREFALLAVLEAENSL